MMWRLLTMYILLPMWSLHKEFHLVDETRRYGEQIVEQAFQMVIS